MAILKCLTHMLDVYSKSHTQGTCVLSDISSTDNLVHYFQSLCGATDLYELKGLQIAKYDVAISNNVTEVLKIQLLKMDLSLTIQCTVSTVQHLSPCLTVFQLLALMALSEVSHGELSNLTESRIYLEDLILRNHTGKRGFLLWLCSYCIAFIYQKIQK